MNQRRSIQAVVALGIIVIGIISILMKPSWGSRVISTSGPSTAVTHPPSLTIVNEEATAPMGFTTLPQLVDSNTLAGTQVYDQIRLSDDGSLLVTKDLIYLFDYFLMASGELDDNIIIRGIETYLVSALQEPALSEALSILSDYRNLLSTLQNGNSLMKDDAVLQSRSVMALYHDLNSGDHSMLAHLKDSLTYLKDMRRQFMGVVVAEAVWGADERFDEYHLSRLEIVRNDSISPAEKQSRLQALQDAYIDVTQSVNNDHQRHHRIMTGDDSVISEDAAYYHNLSTFGEPAARRLATLQHNRRDFQQRYQAYTAERDQILSSGLSLHDKAELIESLKRQSFRARDLSRVNVLDSSP